MAHQTLYTLTNICPLFPPPISKIPQITLTGISTPSISTPTTPILLQQTTSSPVRHSSPTSIKLTTQSYPSLLLYTIPRIEISTKFHQLRELHPTSPPPPHLVSSNKARKPRWIDHL